MVRITYVYTDMIFCLLWVHRLFSIVLFTHLYCLVRCLSMIVWEFYMHVFCIFVNY